LRHADLRGASEADACVTADSPAASVPTA